MIFLLPMRIECPGEGAKRWLGDSGKQEGCRGRAGYPFGKRRLGLTPASILVSGNVEHTNDNGLTLEVWCRLNPLWFQLI